MMAKPSGLAAKVAKSRAPAELVTVANGKMPLVRPGNALLVKLMRFGPVAERSLLTPTKLIVAPPPGPFICEKVRTAVPLAPVWDRIVFERLPVRPLRMPRVSVEAALLAP